MPIPARPVPIPLPHERNGPVRFGLFGGAGYIGGGGGGCLSFGSTFGTTGSSTKGAGGGIGAGAGMKGSGRRGDGPGGMSARTEAASPASNTRASNPNHNAR